MKKTLLLISAVSLVLTAVIHFNFLIGGMTPNGYRELLGYVFGSWAVNCALIVYVEKRWFK